MPESSPLSDSPSPFLRHGATQPVRWLPWGAEAFERARREDRPVLLDVGAVWCHWCHVMDHESYEDPETAALINELYVPVKVDRDERPDVDARYQRAVQTMTGQGGWPLTAFLTPEGEVFFGGTYFPPEEAYGRPSFRRVLGEVARIWREERGRAQEAARQIHGRVAEAEGEKGAAGAVSAGLVERAVEAFAELFDARYGGFGGAPKFPNAGALLLLLDRERPEFGRDWPRTMVAETLDAMARGGLHDQLGGGFHRYSTDARWLVPHFEKMASDNGVLLEVYARASAALDEPYWAEVAGRVVDHYLELAPALLEAGGFPASQDADVGPHDDGDYWTWTRAEVREALGGDERLLRAAALRYGLDDPQSAMPTDRERHVLYLAAGAKEVARALGTEEAEAERTLEEIRRRLKAARDARPRPFVDETVYASWTGLVASGFLAVARYLGRDDARDAAMRALERLWTEGHREEQGLPHRLGDAESGFLDDQTHVAQALLDAYELTHRPVELDRARALMEVVLERYRDASGALVDRPVDEAAPVRVLAEPVRPILDAPDPSGNAVGALVLLRLAALTGEDRFREAAEGVLAAFAGSAPRMITAAATYARAVDWTTAPVTTVVVVGTAGEAGAEAMLRAALRTPRPRTVVRRIEPGTVPEAALPPALAAMVTGAAPRAYLCAGRSCAPPVDTAEALAELMRTFRG